MINQHHHVHGMVKQYSIIRITKEIWSENFCIRIDMKLKDLQHHPSTNQPTKKLFELLKLVPLIAPFLLAPERLKHENQIPT